MAKQFQRWIAGKQCAKSSGAIMVRCCQNDCCEWVPRYALSNVHRIINSETPDEVFLVISIKEKFNGLEGFKALKPGEVQSLLKGDGLQQEKQAI